MKVKLRLLKNKLPPKMESFEKDSANNLVNIFVKNLHFAQSDEFSTGNFHDSVKGSKSQLFDKQVNMRCKLMFD